jgi:hypothetical protein
MNVVQTKIIVAQMNHEAANGQQNPNQNQVFIDEMSLSLVNQLIQIQMKLAIFM